MPHPKLFVLPILAFIVGAFIILDARETWQRSELVESEPTEITCDDLIANGPPANRHIKVTDYQWGEDYVWQSRTDSDEWAYVLIPVYPTGIVPPENGSAIRLAAWIAVADADELEEFLSNHDLVGCSLDNDRGQGHYRVLLAETYTAVNPDAVRVVCVGRELPTAASAQTQLMIGAAIITGGVLLLAWLIRGLLRHRSIQQNQLWYAESNSDDHSHTPTFATNTPESFEPPSELMISLRTQAMYASLAGLPLMGAFYLLQAYGLVNETVGTWGMSVGALALVGGSLGYLVLSRTFVEQTYEALPDNELPRGARKFFEPITRSLHDNYFVHLGDIAVVDTVRASVRLLLDAEKKTLVSLESAMGQTAFNLYSVAADGTLLYTVSINLQRSPESPLPSRCQWTQTKDIRQAAYEHFSMVSEYLAERPGMDCLVIEPEYALGVMDYAHRLSGWCLREAGVTKKKLPPLPTAEQLTKFSQGVGRFEWQAGPHQTVFSTNVVEQLREARATMNRELTATSAEELASSQEPAVVGSQF